MEKEEIEYESFAHCLKGLAHELRLKILNFVGEGEKTVSEIEQYTGRSQSNVSQHLILMKEKNILVSRKEANQIYYSVRDKRIFPTIRQLCEILRSQQSYASTKKDFIRPT